MGAPDRQLVVLVRCGADTSEQLSVDWRNLLNDIAATTPLAEEDAVIFAGKVEFFQDSFHRWIATAGHDVNLRGFATIILPQRPEIAIHLSSAGIAGGEVPSLRRQRPR